MKRQTILSPDRQYRYCLWREWDTMNPSYAMFVGLNPSTADEFADDQTIRKCVRYAKDWNYGALCMVNLFAYRATNPAAMKAQPAPVGVDNDRWLFELAKDAGVIVAAWGVDGTHLNREKEVMRLLAGKLCCLKKTKDGHPGHPLYLDKNLKPLAFA
jgi:hypothetical protein